MKLNYFYTEISSKIKIYFLNYSLTSSKFINNYLLGI